MTTKIKMDCKAKATKVEIPWRVRFFLVFMPLTRGKPKTNKKTATTDNVKVNASINGIFKNGRAKKK